MTKAGIRYSHTSQRIILIPTAVADMGYYYGKCRKRIDTVDDITGRQLDEDFLYLFTHQKH